MTNVYIKSLGCKVNTYDSFDLKTQFESLGYKITESQEEATISVINTCTVTENANKEARYLFRKFKRNNPDSLVVATGCYAQTSAKDMESIAELDYIIPNEEKDNLAKELVAALSKKKEDGDSKILSSNERLLKGKKDHFKTSLTLSAVDGSRSRAFLKIQDGCNSFCSYCIIPYARGKSRSAPFENVYNEVLRLITEGYKEIVFTGIHIGDYGEDFDDYPSYKEKPFVKLLRKLLDHPDMVRIRISSLEPREVSKELVEVLASRKELTCDHFHLPLQSGSDPILKKMNRGYTTSEYQKTIELFREYFPDANIGADVIPGFPGETEKDHLDTLKFIERIGLNYLHVFPYSVRPGTPAARMLDHVPAEVISTRKGELLSLSDQLKANYINGFIGKESEVLFLQNLDKSGRRMGVSKNYLNVALSGTENTIASNSIAKVQLAGKLAKDNLLGKLL